MNFLKKLSYIITMMGLCSLPARAQVTVNYPANGAVVASQFSLSAYDSTCSGQPVSAMGFSLDSSSDNTFAYDTSIYSAVTAPAGPHTLHVKAWGNSGSACDTDVAINVDGVSVSSPGNNATISSTFTLIANSVTCSLQPVAAMGYSFDDGATAFVFSNSMNGYVTAPSGAQTLHVKSWGNQGAACDTDVNITVSGSAIGPDVAPSGGSGPYVPPNAVSVSNIQAFGDWVSVFDPSTSGPATGAMAMVGSPSLSGNALEFYTTYIYFGGELYYASFGDDTTSRNFVYDGWVYLNDSSGSIASVEMDMNQVMSNGETVIFGFQCDGWSGTWDYTENAGTPTAPIDHWVNSSAACNAQTWAQNTWHHVQVSYSRDDYGNVTYQSVWLDGNQQQINATVPSAFALGWGPTLLTNFQVDSIVPGWSSSTVYLDNLTISRW